MTKRPDPDGPQFDFFIPLMQDVPLKDQRETIERPFFSLQKRKRLKPIEYTSPDGAAWVKVEAMPAYGRSGEAARRRHGSRQDRATRLADVPFASDRVFFILPRSTAGLPRGLARLAGVVAARSRGAGGTDLFDG